MTHLQGIHGKKQLATQIRLATIREIASLGTGHLGGSMSICEVLGTLYGGAMRHDPARPDWEERDFLVVSKGHSGPAVYAALATRGYFPMEMLDTLNRGGTHLPSHCDRTLTPGIDMTTGSLGQGLSVAAGITLGHRIDGKENYTFAIIGDGELQEGQNWEAIMTAAQMKLDHLILFLDYNKVQMNGRVDDINSLAGVEQRFADFGWHVQSVNGHAIEEIDQAITSAKAEKGRPSCIVLNTVKGYGCEYALRQKICHALAVKPEDVREDIERLERELQAMQRS